MILTSDYIHEAVIAINIYRIIINLNMLLLILIFTEYKSVYAFIRININRIINVNNINGQIYVSKHLLRLTSIINMNTLLRLASS